MSISPKNRTRVILRTIFFLILALGISILLRSNSSEGRTVGFKGETLDEWFYGNSLSTPLTERTIAIKTMGPNAIPYLAQKLAKRDSYWDKFLHQLYTKLPAEMRVRIRRPQPASEVNGQALFFLSQLNDHLHPFSEELLEVVFEMSSPSLQRGAYSIFEPLTANLASHEQSIAFYKKGLQHPDFWFQLNAAIRLSEISPKTTEGIPFLKTALEDSTLLSTTYDRTPPPPSRPDYWTKKKQQKILDSLIRVSPADAAPYLHLGLQKEDSIALMNPEENETWE